jgi:hypothetical protein
MTSQKSTRVGVSSDTSRLARETKPQGQVDDDDAEAACNGCDGLLLRILASSYF